MTPRFPTTMRRTAWLLAFLGFACKALIPVGFMPAAFGDGWPIKVCSDGWPASSLSEHGAHHHGEDGSDEHWDQCPLGALAGTVPLAYEPLHQLIYLPSTFSQPVDLTGAAIGTPAGFRPRGPPSSSI